MYGKQLFFAALFGDKAIQYYTGLESYKKFKMVLATLGRPSVVNHLNYYNNTIPTLSREDQFLVALMKLRVHHPNEEPALLFGISRKQVSNIFITWINLMCCQWKVICRWPARELVKFFCPRDKFTKFPNIRIIIDGTEFPVEKLTQPFCNKQNFRFTKIEIL